MKTVEFHLEYTSLQNLVIFLCTLLHTFPELTASSTAKLAISQVLSKFLEVHIRPIIPSVFNKTILLQTNFKYHLCQYFLNHFY